MSILVKEHSVQDVLRKWFYWANSKEGYYYWSSIYNKLNKQENGKNN